MSGPALAWVARLVVERSLPRSMDAREDFDGFWENLRPVVAGYLYARTGDQAAVDDLLQETAIAAWRGFGALDADVRREAWVMGIARHKLADHLAQRRPSSHRLEAIPAEAIDEAALRVAEAMAQRSVALRRCLGRLDQRQRDLLCRRYVDDQAVRQIAVAMRLSESNVKVRLHRIRAALRRCVETALGDGSRLRRGGQR